MADNNLEQTGAELVLKGLNDFRTGLAQAVTSLTSVVKVLDTLATTSASVATTTESATRRIVQSDQAIIDASKALASALEDSMGRGSAAISKFMFTEGGGKQILDLFAQIGQAATNVVAEVEAAQRELAQLGSVGTTPLDRNIKFTSGSDKETLQIERQRQANQALADQIHANTLSILGDVDRQVKAHDVWAASVQQNYNRVIAAIATETAAVQRAAQADREALASQANQFAPKIRSYQEITAQIGAYMATLRELEVRESQTFRSGMEAQLKAADSEIAANQRLLQSEQEKRALQADIAPQQAAIAALQEYGATHDKVVNQVSQGSLGFIRAITAMVSASNLLGISGNNAALNIATMAVSFDRLGSKGLLVGGAIGVVLAAIGSLIGAYNTLRQAAESVIGAVVDLTTALARHVTEGLEVATRAAADYQQQLAFTVALLRPTRGELDLLNTKLEDTARTTIFGMGKSAEAVNELARAGVNLTDVVTKGALDAIVALATAANGELNLGDAAKAITGIVGSYRQVINGALVDTVSFTQATDALTGTAQLSRLTFNEVIAAWRQAGPIAASTKISVSDLGAVIAILANAGETASIAGTSLKQVILDLEKPSKAATDELNKFHVSLFTADGAIRPFRDVIIDMNRAFGEQALKEGKVTEEEQKHALAVIFGARAALAANIITNQGVEAFDKMRVAMKDVTAVDMANVLVLPLNARLTILKNNVEALAIALVGPFVSAFSDATNIALKFVQAIPIDNIRLFGQAIVAIATNEGLGVLQAKLTELASPEQLKFFNALIGFGTTVRSALVDQILPAIQTVINRVTGFATAGSTLDGFVEKVNGVNHAIVFVAEVVARSITGLADWVGQLASNQEALNRVKFIVEGLAASIVGSLVVAFALAAPPILTVLNILESIGRTVDPLVASWAKAAGSVSQNADSIEVDLSDITKSNDEVVDSAVRTTTIISGALDAQAAAYLNSTKTIVDSNDIVNRSNASTVDVAKGVADATTTALEETVKAIVSNSKSLVDAYEVIDIGFTDNLNDVVKNNTEGWNDIQDVTKAGVQGTAVAIDALFDPLDKLERAPAAIHPAWASAWEEIGNTVGKIVNYIKDRVNDLVSIISESGVAKFFGDMFQTVANNPVGYISIARNVITTFSGIKTTADSVVSALDKINRILDPTKISTDTTAISGKLRDMLDNINANAEETRKRIAALLTPSTPSTQPGDYPVKEPKIKGPEIAYNRALDQAEEFGNDLSDKIQKAGIQAIQKLEDIARKAAEATVIAIREYEEKSTALTTKAIQERNTAIEDLNQRRQDRELTQNLDHLLKLEAQTRSFARTDRDNRISDERETQDRVQAVVERAISHGFDLQQRQKALNRSREREDEDIAYKRAEDDEERHQQRLDDLRNKPGVRQTAEDIKKLQQQGGFSKAISNEETLANQRIARQRANEDKDRARSRTRQDEDTQFAEGQYIEQIQFQDEAEARKYRTTIQRRTEDRTRSRQDTLDDAEFEQHQAEVRQSLQDNIENAGLNRRLVAIEQNRIEQQKILDRELQETKDKINASAIEQARDVMGVLGNTLTDVQRMIQDKAPEILKAGGDAMQPVMDAIVANLQAQMNIVYEAAHQARLELELVAQAQATAPTTPPAANTVAANTPAVQPATQATPYYNSQPNLAPVPGTSNYSTGQQAIPATTQVLAPSGAQTTTVINNVNYNVEASYANMQSPASIEQDLSAIVMLGRR